MDMRCGAILPDYVNRTYYIMPDKAVFMGETMDAAFFISIFRQVQKACFSTVKNMPHILRSKDTACYNTKMTEPGEIPDKKAIL